MNNAQSPTSPWHVTRTVLIIVVSVAIVTSLFRLTEAGSLTPSAAPASSSETFEQLYNALASSGFDSSAISGSKNGSALQIAKCIIEKMTGGTPCP